MTIPADLKTQLGKNTEKLEKKAGELLTNYAPYYSKLEPWQRGLLLIALTTFLLLAIYYLTKEDKHSALRKKQEKEAEEKLLRQMAFFKKLKE